MKHVLLLLFLALSLSGCALSTTASTTAPPVTTYQGTTTVLDYAGLSHLSGYDEIFTRSTSAYIVYLYSPACHNCTAIRAAVHDFATSHTLHPIYFLNVDQVDSDGREDYLARTGQVSIGVPCMVLISEQGSFDPEETGLHLARGSAAVLELIARIEADNVPHWN